MIKELAWLAREMKKYSRASIKDRQRVLAAVQELQSAGMTWLAEGETEDAARILVQHPLKPEPPPPPRKLVRSPKR